MLRVWQELGNRGQHVRFGGLGSSSKGDRIEPSFRDYVHTYRHGTEDVGSIRSLEHGFSGPARSIFSHSSGPGTVVQRVSVTCNVREGFAEGKHGHASQRYGPRKLKAVSPPISFFRVMTGVPVALHDNRDPSKNHLEQPSLCGPQDWMCASWRDRTPGRLRLRHQPNSRLLCCAMASLVPATLTILPSRARAGPRRSTSRSVSCQRKARR